MQTKPRSLSGVFYWGRFAALRGHARSHRIVTGPEAGAIPVGAGVPAKGCKAALASQRLV
ncbi:hypothetical protein CHR26_09520 [Pseudomonas putida]|nr:hypothetical protein CHR26_09520 [Pseudomonas putida]